MEPLGLRGSVAPVRARRQPRVETGILSIADKDKPFWRQPARPGVQDGDQPVVMVCSPRHYHYDDIVGIKVVR